MIKEKIVSLALLLGALLIAAPGVNAADVVTLSTVTLGDTSRFILSGYSDGTGESAVKKIDISELPGTPTKVKIQTLKWSVTAGMNVELLFDHTSDDRAISLSGEGFLDDTNLKDPASSGGTGDLLLTTTGFATSDGYVIDITVRNDGS